MLYLRAALHHLLRLPPPHVHEWQWGTVRSQVVQHEAPWGGPEGEPFKVFWQDGYCRGCGAAKRRRVQ